MSCTIIDPAIIKINGGTSICGGVMSKVSLNFALLAGATTASVTVVQDGATQLTPPVTGDEFTLDIIGMNLKFIAKGFSMQDSAGAATSLTLNLSDMSHVFLDQNYIALKEEFPNWQSFPHVDVIGTKIATFPYVEASAGNATLTLNRDTKWGDIRTFYNDIEKALREFKDSDGNSYGLRLTQADIDYQVNAANGKTLWNTNVDPYGSDTLASVMEDVIIGDLPDGEFDFSGTYRSVLLQLANTLGLVAYWDCEENKAAIPDSFDTEGGLAKLDALSSSCEVIATDEKSDFSTSMSVGAVGSFSSAGPGENQENTQGGKMKKYYSAKLLNPTFYYTPCKDVGNANAMLKLDLKDPDTLTAMAASFDDEVYSMYALQSVLHQQSAPTEKDLKDTLQEVPLQGRQNIIANLNTKWADGVKEEPFAALYTRNVLLSTFYTGGEEEAEDAEPADNKCLGIINPFQFEFGSNLQEAVKAKAKTWNDDEDQAPYSVGGEWLGTTFLNGVMFLKGPSALQSILKPEGGLATGTDVFQQYLAAIASFNKRYYVVREQSGLRSTFNKLGADYGFYVSAENAQSFTPPAGYGNKPVNPYISVSDCGIDEIKTLFLALSSMCNNNGGCMTPKMEGVSFIDFINVLYKNNIKAFFSNPQNFNLSPVVETAEEAANETGPKFLMHLLVAEETTDYKSIFSPTKVTCWDIQDGINTFDITHKAKDIAEKITTLKLKGKNEAANVFSSLEENKVFMITDEDIGKQISPLELPESAPRKLKLWYDVESSAGSLSAGPGQFFICGANIPPKDKEVWTGTVNFGLSINAADVSQQNELISEWEAKAAEEGSPYSRANQVTMATALGTKLGTSARTDKAPAYSRSITIILGENTSGLELPSPGEGLEALSISTAGGKVTITMTVGNSFERAQKKQMFQLMASNSHLQHVSNTQVPDTFTSQASPRFAQIAKGQSQSRTVQNS